MKEPLVYDHNRYDGYTVLGRISSAEEHVVEDARTHRSTQRTEISEKKKSNKVHSGKGRVLLTILITIFAFSLTLVAADILSGRSSISQYVALITRKHDEATVYYCVYAMKTEDMALAYKNAAAVRAEGGAGYVLKDQNTFYVVLNAYSDEKDAKAIAEKEVNYAIYEIRSPAPNSESEKLSYLSSTKNIYAESYHVLYQSANDLASGKYGEEDMKRSLQKQREKIIAAQETYAESIRGIEDNARIEYKVLLAEIRGAFDNLLENSNSLVSDARYYSVMILHAYSLFAEKHIS